jgi:hypothetical protein
MESRGAGVSTSATSAAPDPLVPTAAGRLSQADGPRVRRPGAGGQRVFCSTCSSVALGP